MNKKHVIGYTVTTVLAFAIGAAAGSGGSGGSGSSVVAATASAPTVTATATVTASTPGPAKTVTVQTPGPTVTVTSPKPAKTITVKVTPTPRVAFAGDGTYQVGIDIKAGTYVSSTPDSGNCYWGRLSGSDGMDNIIDNSNSAGQSVVTIQPSDKLFESNGCNDWTRRY